MVGGDSSAKKTEIVSLTEGSPIPECLSMLSDHPNDLRYSAGGALPEAGKIKVYLFCSNLQNSVCESHLL